MAYTRDGLRSNLRDRLKDPGVGFIWTNAELDGYLDKAIEGLYPAYYIRNVATTVAGTGPLQTTPANVRNLYLVGHQRVSSTRVRPLRGWAEGSGNAHVPKTGIAGDTLVWCWTTGFTAPLAGNESLTIPTESVGLVLIRASITALEALISDKASTDKYHALQVRQGNSEDDVLNTLDALHASYREHLANVVPLPEVKR